MTVQALRGPRREIDVAAEVAAQLHVVGLLADASPAALAQTLKIPVRLVRSAQGRVHDNGYVAPRTVPDSSHGNARRRPANKREHDGDTHKQCRRCNRQLPVEEFRPRADANSRRPWCRACEKTYKAERYLSVRVGEHFGTLLRLILVEGDPMVGQPCQRCGGALVVDERVEADDVTLRHQQCPHA